MILLVLKNSTNICAVFYLSFGNKASQFGS